jgi:hypothetical protein
VDIETPEQRARNEEIARETVEGYSIPLTAEGTLPHYQPDTPHENILQALSEFCGIQWGMKQQVAEEIVEHFKARWRFDWENGGSPRLAAPLSGEQIRDAELLEISTRYPLGNESQALLALHVPEPISETPATPEEEHHETA